MHIGSCRRGRARHYKYHRWVIHVLNLGALPYPDYLALARALVDARATGEIPDLLCFATHPPVITLGLASQPDEILQAGQIEIVQIERGGHTTYHGPDQQMLYPVVQLELGDLHGFVRRLQEVVALGCAALGATAFRRDGYPGVWTDKGKLASIGLALKKRVTLHGMALNCDQPASGGFDAIIPCGLSEITMTSLADETGYLCSRFAVRSALCAAWEAVYGERVVMADAELFPPALRPLLPSLTESTTETTDHPAEAVEWELDEEGEPLFRFTEGLPASAYLSAGGESDG